MGGHLAELTARPSDGRGLRAYGAVAKAAGEAYALCAAVRYRPQGVAPHSSVDVAPRRRLEPALPPPLTETVSADARALRSHGLPDGPPGGDGDDLSVVPVFGRT
ncbi:hypothetical protein OG311_40025 (plasmid) [Streptomyces sp. NBC_01343]|uniref:hypothetical protein n=1 Tax=Streptomyces sp. NBC_01343 TaxID=2903832 RepID=UPI002E0FBD09|nr:hypothetical protein OG311_40025 [Streptomyces sp. NBC_01343]